MSDLLPCPFCPPGIGKPRLSRSGRYVLCEGCGTEAFVEAWNRRAPAASGVPREPTMRMLEAGSDAADTGKLTHIWRAMWDAAPKPNDAEDAASKSDCGHGHVYTRADGARARCGGPGICPMCSIDAARKEGK